MASPANVSWADARRNADAILRGDPKHLTGDDLLEVCKVYTNNEILEKVGQNHPSYKLTLKALQSRYQRAREARAELEGRDREDVRRDMINARRASGHMNRQKGEVGAASKAAHDARKAKEAESQGVATDESTEDGSNSDEDPLGDLEETGRRVSAGTLGDDRDLFGDRKGAGRTLLAAVAGALEDDKKKPSKKRKREEEARGEEATAEPSTPASTASVLKPALKKRAVQKLTAVKSAIKRVAFKEPLVEGPAVAKSPAVEPAAAKPAPKTPAVGEPAVAKPAVAKPAVAKPAVKRPAPSSSAKPSGSFLRGILDEIDRA